MICVDMKVLVLGFYNLDTEHYSEGYRLVFSELFKDVTFMNPRDVTQDNVREVLQGVQAVICGGGDVIGDAFMQHVKFIAKHTTAPLYAVSIGIPCQDDLHYLTMFDHVFVRSKTELFHALQTVGSPNASAIPDLTYRLAADKGGLTRRHAQDALRFGFILSSAVFNTDVMIKMLCDLISNLSRYYDVDIYLLSLVDKDQAFNELVCTMCNNPRVYAANISDIFGTLSRMDFLILNRYSAATFAIAFRIPFLALCTSRKLEILLKEHALVDRGIYFFAEDVQANTCMQSYMDDLVTLIHDLQKPLDMSAKQQQALFKTVRQGLHAIQKMVKQRKRRIITHHLMNHALYQHTPSFEEGLARLAKLNASISDVTIPLKELTAATDTDIDTLAHAICYAMTNTLSYDGSLQEWMAGNDTATLLQYVEWLHNDYKRKRAQTAKWCVPSSPFVHRAFIHLYPFTQSDAGEHRSGWPYMLKALHVFDGTVHTRSVNLVVDTYIDRTFHWAKDVLVASAVLPYIQPWIGFVHHTFDAYHSDCNVTTLFSQDVFLHSLKTCKALVVFSEYLKSRLQRHLTYVHLPNIKVYAITPPAEFPKLTFSPCRFRSNTFRRVIQIGTWLRDLYAIYELPLDTAWGNPLCLKKSILIGKDMCHPPLLQSLTACLNKDPSNYTKGIVQMLSRQLASVDVLPYVDPAGYDQLLSQNIVFLFLVDVSSVNTIIECIIRNTPFIVNRHAAIEELVGKDYPGFYTCLSHAAHLLGSITKLLHIHYHLKYRTSKSRYKVDRFLHAFGNVLKGVVPE